MANAADLGAWVALMLEGLALSETTMRCAIIWQGQEYPVSGGPEIFGKSIDEGGFRLDTQLKLKVRVELFASGEIPDIPQEGQTIEYRRNATAIPKRYRIVEITNFYGAFLQLKCNEQNRGA